MSSNKLMSWEDYPDALHVISLGAGRQSSVMYLMACAGEITPRPHCAVFADTGNEPAHVYKQLEYLQRVGNIPIHVVSNGNIYNDSMEALNGGTPWGSAGRWLGPPAFVEGGGPISRKCTRQYKIQPKEDAVRAIMRETGAAHVVDWRGHTTNEVHRAKPDSRKYYLVRWPLLEQRMSNADCAAWLERNGHPQFEWSACEICPFRLRDLHYARKLSEDAAAWERITTLDERLRDLSPFGINRPAYLNADYIDMSGMIQRPQQPGLFDFDCDGGACGL